jgi:hypothetical protein
VPSVQLRDLVRGALRRAAQSEPEVHPFPYPYRAAVAVSNDCEFMSWDHYLGIYRLLNDPAGLDLEIGTSLFFFVTNALCHSSFSYFDAASGAPSADAPAIREMVEAGYIDTVHAYGDFDDGSFTRQHAELVVEECERHGMRFPFWTNHGSDRNFQNLGHEHLAVYQRGDDPTAPQYHLDLLRRVGAEFFWVDDGYQQSVGEGTRVLYSERARDGSELQLVRRFRGLHGKPPPMAKSLPEQMTTADLDLLVERREACIYYQHLGAWERSDPTTFSVNTPPYFEDAGLEVLDHLSSLFRRGACLVTTPARLLRYLRARDTVEVAREGAALVIRADADIDLTGLTIECSSRPDVVLLETPCERTPLEVEIHELGDVTVVTLPWSRLPAFAW